MDDWKEIKPGVWLNRKTGRMKWSRPQIAGSKEKKMSPRELAQLIGKKVRWAEGGSILEGHILHVSGENLRINVVGKGKLWRSLELVMKEQKKQESVKASKEERLKKKIGTTVEWFDGDDHKTPIKGVIRAVNGESLKIEVSGRRMFWRHYTVVIGKDKSDDGPKRAPDLNCAPSTDMYSSPSFEDVMKKPLPWNRVTSIACSSSGTSGVLFVRFGLKGGVVVLKCATDAAEELYATELASRCGLPVVKSRMLTYKDKDGEYYDLINTLQRAPVGSHEYMKIHKRFMRTTGCILVMSMIPSPVKLFNLSSETFDAGTTVLHLLSYSLSLNKNNPTNS